MPTTKLTLSADRELIRRAKKVAAKNGTSLSAMVSNYLSTLTAEEKEFQPGPLSRQATGLAKVPKGKSDRELLEEALSEKYGL